MTTISALIILVGLIIGAQWLHLAIRQRGNPRLRMDGPKEWQVIGLGTCFFGGAVLWALGLASTFQEEPPTTEVLVAAGRAAIVLAHLFNAACAIVLATIGSGLRIAAIERIGRGFSWGSAAPDALITDGVYRFMKHPLVRGYVCQVMALLFCAPTFVPAVTITTVLLLLATIVCAAVQVRKEERVLAERFPEEWPKYAKWKIL